MNVQGEGNLCANSGKGQYSAQIELREAGDFVLRRDNVETVCRRINPDDYDGDGIANGMDAEPLVWNGDCFGPANELLTNAAQNAYYTVLVVGPKTDSLIIFTGDGPSNYPDPCFVSRACTTNEVVLLIGKTYHGC